MREAKSMTYITIEKEKVMLALEALKLIAAQDQGCGGNVSEAEAWRSAQSIALANITAIEEALAEPEQEPVITDAMVEAAVKAFWGYENSKVCRTAYRLAIKAALQEKFCDDNCVWTDHHPDCKLGKPDRQELQAKGEHPAPCARFCEANAFQIEIRNLKAKLENQHPEWYHTKNIHGCDVFYHKTEERSYMSGQITPLYTTPPQRKPLTDEKISLIAHNIDSGDWNDLNFKECWHEGFKAGFREAEIEHNIKGTT